MFQAQVTVARDFSRCIYLICAQIEVSLLADSIKPFVGLASTLCNPFRVETWVRGYNIPIIWGLPQIVGPGLLPGEGTGKCASEIVSKVVVGNPCSQEPNIPQARNMP